MKTKIGLPKEHQRRNDAIVGEHPLNYQVVPVVLLKVVLVVAREAQGILFHTRTLRIVKMKVRGWVTVSVNNTAMNDVGRWPSIGAT